MDKEEKFVTVIFLLFFWGLLAFQTKSFIIPTLILGIFIAIYLIINKIIK